jgi:class 3 adenylate cyclase
LAAARSTALSARMDPEDLREVISAYQKCVAETVQRFGGFVAKYMGDGVLVFLGYPQAHEDDAERAVRAGLELVAAVGAPTECPRSLRYSTATSAPYAVGKPRAARALPATRVPHLARKQRRIGEELCHCSPD